MSVAPRTAAISAFAIFCICAIVYGSNSGNLYAYDSAPTSLFVLNAMEHRTLAFDDFRGSYLQGLGAGYAFIEAPNGHLESQYPIGTTLLTAPFYVAQYAVDRVKHAVPDVLSPASEAIRLRDEKRAAIVVGALAATLFFLCAIQLANIAGSSIATAAFAFGSEMWTIGSQALWQHGPIAVVTLAMILALLRLSKSTRQGRPLFLAGLFAGFLPVVRPTAILYGLAGLAFALRYGKPHRKLFLVGFAIGIMPGLMWNAFAFHALFGGYQTASQSYAFTLPQAVTGFKGLLVSPNRGLLVFMPWVVFAAAGAYRASVERTPEAHLLRCLGIASLATFANYVFFENWHAGSGFGPRYLTDLVPTLALLVAYAWPAGRAAATGVRRVFSGTLVLTVALASAVQAAGAYGEPFTNWSGVPLDLTRHTERIWQWRDSQIQRDALATYRLWTPNPTFPQRYADDYDGKILTIAIDGSTIAASPLRVASTATITLAATLANSGRSIWYGYDTGLYYGRTHVRVRFIDAAGNVALEQTLYVSGTTLPGMGAVADGTISVPAKTGRYEAVFDIDVLQDARIGSRHVGARSLMVDVTGD